MKKIDKLILQLFIRYFLFALPFVLLLLTMQRMINFFPRFVGKGLETIVLVKLFGYLMVNALFFGMPLSIMLASLMTYGNLGEHSELTAIKSAGFSMLRLLRPTFFMALAAVGFNVLLNLYFTPHMNLKLFTLLYDIKHKKPSFQLEEKEFHSSIPGYTLRVGKKFPNNRSFKDVIIYDHSTRKHRIILADSCLMYTENQEKNLLLELFDGYYYIEPQKTNNAPDKKPFIRTQFRKMDLRFSLSSFDFKRSQESVFSHIRFAKTVPELFLSTKMLYAEAATIRKNARDELYRTYNYQPQQSSTQSTESTDSIGTNTVLPLGMTDGREETNTSLFSNTSPLHVRKYAEALKDPMNRGVQNTENTDTAHTSSSDTPSLTQIASQLDAQDLTASMRTELLKKIRNIQSSVAYHAKRLKSTYKELYRYEIEAYRRYAFAFSCLAMYLIGAPLGSIIKRGGLGLPLIISTLFCIMFYVLNTLYEKYAREGFMSTWQAAWLPNLWLGVIGSFFLWLAMRDSQILEWDRYRIFFQKLLRKENS